MCYSGKLNENSEPLSLGLSWVDGKKMYPVYLDLTLWEDAAGKNIKLIKSKYFRITIIKSWTNTSGFPTHNLYDLNYIGYELVYT